MRLEGEEPEQHAGRHRSAVEPQNAAEEQRGAEETVLAADGVDQTSRRKSQHDQAKGALSR